VQQADGREERRRRSYSETATVLQLQS